MSLRWAGHRGRDAMCRSGGHCGPAGLPDLNAGFVWTFSSSKILNMPYIIMVQIMVEVFKSRQGSPC